MKCKKARNYLRGGPVRGPGTATSDSILARVSNGEYILPEPAVDMVGVQNLEALRRRAIDQAPRFMSGGAVTDVAKYVVRNPEKAVSAALGKAGNVGTGPMGGLGMMINSQDAVAPSLDVTREKAYQRAYDAVQAGKGEMANLREWNITSNLLPPSNQDVLNQYNQQQANTDAIFREQGQIAPSDRRALADMNRFNPRAYAPGYALGGMVDNYGNDLTLANRMNAGAESMRAMREGPATQPTTQPASGLSGLSSLFGPSPLQQQQQAYKAARGSADALDVASGRFDREYQPGFAMGGQVGMDQGQWDRLPGFKDGGDPMELTPEERAMAERNRQAATQFMSAMLPEGGFQYGKYPRQPAIDQDLGAGPGMGAARVTQPSVNMMARKKYAPPALPVVAGQGDPLAGRLPDASWMTTADRAYGATQPLSTAPSFPTTPGPGAGGLTAINATARGQELPPMYTTGSRQVVTMPANTLYGATGPVQGSALAPQYETGYRDARGNTMTVTGTNQRVGGGTLSVMDQGNGGTTEGNVAAINRQYEALRSRNQAYGMGDGGGMPAGPDTQTLAMLANPFYQSGQSYGDEVLNRDRFMRQTNRQRGEGRKSFQQRQQGVLAQLQGLQEQGQQRAQGALGLAGLGQQQQQASYAAQLAQLKALQDAQQFAATYGLQRRAANWSEQKDRSEMERNAINDRWNIEKIKQDIQRGDRPTADAALGQARANYMQAMVAGDQAGIQQWGSVLNIFSNQPSYLQAQ